MRTLALTAALATALTGTGCIVNTSDPVGDLDLAWQFRNSDGVLAGNFTSTNSGCGTAAIEDVQVEVFDAFNRPVVSRSFFCQESPSGFPRAFIPGLAVGSYSYLVTASRSGSAVFDGSGFFDVFDNDTAFVDATLDVLTVAPLSIYFTQNGAATCAGTPFIRYDLFTAGGALIESNDQVACDPVSTGFTVTLDQPTGLNYGVDLFALTAGGASVNERCLQTVRHTGFPAPSINLLPAPQAACGP
jgi:hypothetical protein